jgi:hypothetical protein
MERSHPNVIPFKHPGDYSLIINAEGLVYRYPSGRMLPDGFCEYTHDINKQTVYEKDGRLSKMWWQTERF